MNIPTTDFSVLASFETTRKAAEALTTHNFRPVFVENGAEAFEQIKNLIPPQASVMNGSSRTLEQIGFVEHLKSGTHGWNNLHEAVLKETDKAKQAELRKHAVVSDYYLGSAHAVTEEGEIVVASNTGSQMPHLVYTSPNLILVVGRQKIVPNLAAALQRIDTYVLPLEHENMQQKYGINSTHAKTVILHKENPSMGRNITIFLVNEKLGF